MTIAGRSTTSSRSAFGFPYPRSNMEFAAAMRAVSEEPLIATSISVLKATSV
jgi:hypothetical protein